MITRPDADVLRLPEPPRTPEPPPSPPGHPRRSPALAGLLAFGSYLVVSFLLYGLPLLSRFGRVFVGEGRGDAHLYAWSLAWWPHAIEHGLNPFLPKVVWAPHGTNMAWVTGLPGPALVMWPVTALLGPVVASNVLSVLAPALSAWAGYLLFRRAARGRFMPALAAGYLFGFSTYLIAQLRGHMNLFLVFPVPLAVYLVVRHAEGSIGNRRFIALLALVLVAEFSISTEVFASMTFFAALATIGVWWRMKEARRRLWATGSRVALAYIWAAVVLAPYLYYVAVGAPKGPIRPVVEGSSAVDLLSYLVPRASALVGGPALAHITDRFRPNLSEDGAYLSPVLLMILVHAAWTSARRDRVIRLSLAFAGIAGLFALGTVLHVDGHPTIPLPWAVFARVPLLQDALPQRFTLYAWLAVAIVVARWLAAAPRPAWRYAAVGAAAIMLLPNVLGHELHGPASAPAFFSKGMDRSYLDRGQIVLILHAQKGEDMLWQADARFRFSMSEGYTGPEPEAFRRDPTWAAIRDDDPGRLNPGELRAFLVSHGVTAVIVEDSVAARWRSLLAQTLLVEPQHVGGVQLYLPRPGPSGI